MEWPNNKSPEEIIGLENMGLFEAHFAAVRKCRNSEETVMVIKNLGLTQDETKLLGQKYKELRKNRIYPDGIDAKGNVTWAISTPSPVEKLMRKKEMEERKNGQDTSQP